MTKLNYIIDLLQFVSFPPELVANKKIRDLLPTKSGEMVNNRLVEFKPQTVSSGSCTPPPPPSASSIPVPLPPFTRQRATNFATPPNSPIVNSPSQRVAAHIYQTPSNPFSNTSLHNWRSDLL